jgi:hypothetical protein
MKMSGPEARFDALRTRLGLFDITGNDGKESVELSGDGQGTSLIRDGTLFSDNRRDYAKGLKNYGRIQPDHLRGRDFVEIKGTISGKTWMPLSHFMLNDNLRTSLLRMKVKAVPDIRRRYDQLTPGDRQAVDQSLSRCNRADPRARHYVRWEDLITAITSPNQNLAETTFICNGRDLPIKIIAGMEGLPSGKLYVVDNEVMNRWDQL